MAKYVLALAFRGNCWLMVRNRNRGWEFAGGKVEPGETSRDAAIRECHEETGCTFVPRDSFVFGDGEVFAGELEKSGEPITDPDILEWKWVDMLPRELGFPEGECKEIVRQARRLLGN